jgi:hypothetical protein
VDRKLGYSDSFHEFVALWYACNCNGSLSQSYIFLFSSLTKNFRERPKHKELLEQPFLVKARTDNDFDASEFITSILDVSRMERQQILTALSIDQDNTL